MRSHTKSINDRLYHMVFLYIYITIDNIFFNYFVIFFVVIVVVQFCIILVKNGMFYRNHKSSYLVTHFYYVIDNMSLYLWKRIDKILTQFGDAN